MPAYIEKGQLSKKVPWLQDAMLILWCGWFVDGYHAIYTMANEGDLHAIEALGIPVELQWLGDLINIRVHCQTSLKQDLYWKWDWVEPVIFGKTRSSPNSRNIDL